MTSSHDVPPAPASAAPVAQRHTLVVDLHDRPGALYRALGLVRRRNYDVSDLVVAAGRRAGMTRIVLAVESADVHQVVHQLMRLVDVVSVDELAHDDTPVSHTTRELSR